MIESICCMLIMIIARITAGVYVKKFNFLNSFIVPLDVACGVFAVIVIVFIILNIVKAIKKK